MDRKKRNPDQVSKRDETAPDDALDIVHSILIHRNAGVFFLDDQFFQFPYGGVFPDADHVHAWGHDFFGDGVPEFHNAL